MGVFDDLIDSTSKLPTYIKYPLYVIIALLLLVGMPMIAYGQYKNQQRNIQLVTSVVEKDK